MTNRERFEKEVLVHMPAAYHLAWLLLRSRAEAEDAVQDAFLRAFRAFDQCQGLPKPWLLAIVRNVSYRRIQDRRRRDNVVSIDEVLGQDASPHASQLTSSDCTPEQSAVLNSELALLERAMQALPPVFREVLALREVEGLSYREIADVIGAPVGTVMSRLSRARDDVRSAMLRLSEEDDANAV